MIKKLISGTLIGLMMISSVGYVQASGTGTTAPTDPFVYQGKKHEDYKPGFELNQAPGDLLFSDDFSSTLNTSNFVTNENGRSVVTNGYLESTQAVTDEASNIHSKWIELGDKGVEVEYDFYSIPNNNYFYGSLKIILNDNENYRGLFESKHEYSEFYNGGYKPLRNKIIGNYFDGNSWSTVTNIEGIHNAWVKHKIKIDIANNQLTHNVNGVSYVKNIELSQYTGKKIKLMINPYGWSTGHKVRTDNIKVYSLTPSIPPSTNIPGLVADYTLNGNANDTSGNANHGTASNVTYETLPNGNKVAVFNGSSSKIDTTSPGLTNNYSVSLWGTKGDADSLLFSMYNSYIAFSSTSQVSGVYYDGTRDNPISSNINDNDLHHILWIKSNVGQKLFIDGKLVKTETSTSNLSTNYNSNIGLGYFKNFNANFYNGKLAQVKLFNRAVTETEITQLYSEGMNYLGIIPPPPSTNIPGLVADYTLNGNAKDTSGNGNHGTASNITYETLANGNKVAVFNGSSSIKSNLNYTNEGSRTLSVNFKLSSYGNYGGILLLDYNENNSFVGIATLGTQGGLRLTEGGGDVIINHEKLDLNKWYNITLIYNNQSGIVSAYKNGILLGTFNGTPGFKLPNNTLQIGMLEDYYRLNGNIQGAKIFNRALTETEVNQLYNEGIQYLGLSTSPTAPTSFSTTDIKNNQVAYAWTDTSSGTSQESKFVLKNESNQIVVDNIAIDATTYTETGLSANTSYQRKICAVNSAGEVCSELITIKTLLDSAPSEKTTLFDFYGLSITVIETTKFFKISFTIGKFKINFSIENTEIL